MWEFADKNIWWEKGLLIPFYFVINFLENTKLKMNWALNPFRWMVSLCNVHNFISASSLSPFLSHFLSPSLYMPFIHSFIHATKHAYKYQMHKESNKSHTKIPQHNMNKFLEPLPHFQNGLYEIICWKS